MENNYFSVSVIFEKPLCMINFWMSVDVVYKRAILFDFFLNWSWCPLEKAIFDDCWLEGFF